MIALLLGKTGISIPFSASFNMETLDNVFQVGDSAAMNSVRLCPDAAFVLLAMARVLLHQVRHCLVIETFGGIFRLASVLNDRFMGTYVYFQTYATQQIWSVVHIHTYVMWYVYYMCGVFV